jgi:hypothetical protein
LTVSKDISSRLLNERASIFPIKDEQQICLGCDVALASWPAFIDVGVCDIERDGMHLFVLWIACGALHDLAC